VVNAEPGNVGMSASSKRITLLASVGGVPEYYDFFVYGVFATDIARAVFPEASPFVSLISSGGAFAIA